MNEEKFSRMNEEEFSEFMEDIDIPVAIDMCARLLIDPLQRLVIDSEDCKDVNEARVYFALQSLASQLLEVLDLGKDLSEKESDERVLRRICAVAMNALSLSSCGMPNSDMLASVGGTLLTISFGEAKKNGIRQYKKAVIDVCEGLKSKLLSLDEVRH